MSFRLFVSLLQVSACLSFQVSSPPGKQRGAALHATSRRELLTGGGMLLVAALPANAQDELFRGNPLTNPFLEKLRIWEQLEADELKYGGELEAGDAGNKGQVEAYPRLLVPILEMGLELATVQSLVNEKNLQGAKRILDDPKYQTVNFKKVFNRYGDNIYFGDPDRANVYLGGGASPKSEQSLAYLLRNDILTNLDDLQAEVDYLLKNPDETLEDATKYASATTTAFKKYLTLVPPDELERAKRLASQEAK
jgi:hypothetical protein